MIAVGVISGFVGNLHLILKIESKLKPRVLSQMFLLLPYFAFAAQALIIENIMETEYVPDKISFFGGMVISIS